MPNEVTVTIRGDMGEYFRSMREEIPPILTSLAQATVQATIPKAPGRLGYTLSADPARPIGHNAWESGIISTDAEKFHWHEFGTGIHKEKGAKARYPITAKQSHGKLAFVKEGKLRVIKGKGGAPAIVMHPGVPARGMLRQAIREMLPPYMEMFRRLGMRVLPTWGRG